jgi:hypothetical protein
LSSKIYRYISQTIVYVPKGEFMQLQRIGEIVDWG